MRLKNINPKTFLGMTESKSIEKQLNPAGILEKSGQHENTAPSNNNNNDENEDEANSSVEELEVEIIKYSNITLQPITDSK